MNQLSLPIRMKPRLEDIAPEVVKPPGAEYRVHLCKTDTHECGAPMWHIYFFWRRSRKPPSVRRACSKCDAAAPRTPPESRWR